MMSTFAGKVVLITGAGSGLGRHLAVTLAGEGARIAAIDLRAEPLVELAKELGNESMAWAVADVTDRTALHAAVELLHKRLGPVDVLIANAGIGRETSALEFRAADVEAQVRVNLIGVANTVEAVLPDMLARQCGHLVVISSLASYRGVPRMLGYCASKAGVRALFDGLRMELRPKNIAVTTICPGWIRTPLTEDIPVPKENVMDVDLAARRIVDVIRRRRPFCAFPFRPAWQLRILRSLPAGLSDWLLGRWIQRLMRRQGEDVGGTP